jgi:hypothetical protein
MYGEAYYNWPTVSDEAKRIYPGVPFDTAFPHDWLKRVSERFSVDPRAHGVWGYPPNGPMGGIFLPITQEGVMMAGMMATYVG